MKRITVAESNALAKQYREIEARREATFATTILPPHWQWSRNETGPKFIERSDGYYVWWSQDNYHAQPWVEGHRCFEVYPKDGPALAFRRKGTTYKIPRRWKSAAAAIKSLDKEIPLIP